uniref:Lectin/glucanase superfamily protein n=1 Tax=viral metagenome TaxID=1070528 RepID=A0A6M3ISQ0_9ZZZZ
MGIVRANWSKYAYGRQVFYDKSNGETLQAMYPVQLYDDFLGEAYNTTFWGTTETVTIGTLVAGLIDDAVNGIMGLGLDNTDEAQIAAMHFGDNLCLSMAQGLIFECRLTFLTLPTTGTETVQAVFGLASGHNATLDSIATNAWFRIESAANTTLLWETDNGDTDDDDNDASTTLVASTYNVYRIDCTSTSAIKFYVDDVLVGTSDMSTTLSAAEAKVQPYFNVSKAKSSANTGTGTMYIDYIRCFQSRS